jgi:hypothetical protein
MRGGARSRVERQRVWRARRPPEVEVGGEVPKHARILAHVGTRVGAAVGAWVKPLTTEEVVLDELVHRVE